MPIGLYQKRSNQVIHHNDLVSLCLPKPIAVVGKKKNYLGSGVCPDNTTPLLKEVIALPGDRVALSPNLITVNGFHYFAPQQRLDHCGKSLHHWVQNKVYSNVNTVWVYGSGDPIYSWDSRYYGGIPSQNIRGIYKAIWIWRKSD